VPTDEPSPGSGVDASVAVKVVVTELDSDKPDAWFDDWAHEGKQLIAPAFFEVETDSLLRQKTALRQELTPEQAEAAFAKLQTLPIQQMAVLGQRQRAWEVAAVYGFATVYDATYLALAELGNAILLRPRFSTFLWSLGEPFALRPVSNHGMFRSDAVFHRLTSCIVQVRVAGSADAIEPLYERSFCLMHVALLPDLEQLVTARVQSGRYSSVSEVIREALLLLEEREQRYEVQRQELRHKIAEGLAQLDRGEGIPGAQVFAELDAELDALEKTRKTE
jgi:antitoxin ParD1/3/4